MEIVVGLKLSPRREDLELSREGQLVRRDRTLRVGHLDRAALAWGLRLKGAGDRLVVVAMAPPHARAGLGGVLSEGVDEALLLSDPQLAGADALATAHVLASLIHARSAALVLTGAFSEDGGTGLVGPMVAGLLDWPVATWVRELGRERRKGPAGLVAVRGSGQGAVRLGVPLPAVITLAAGPFGEGQAPPPVPLPREPSPVRQLDATAAAVRPPFSPTRVVEIWNDPSGRAGVRFAARDREAALAAVRHAIQRPPRPARAEARPTPPPGLSVAVLGAEEAGDGQGDLLAAVAFARERVGPAGRVTAWCARPLRAGDVRQLGQAGADAVRDLSRNRSAWGDARQAAHSLEDALAAEAPSLILASHRVHDRELAAYLAARLGLGVFADAADLRPDGGRWTAIKAAPGGAAVRLEAIGHGVVATMAPGFWAGARQRPGAPSARPEVAHLAVREGAAVRIRRRLHEPAPPEAMARRPVLVGIGLGVGREGVPAVVAAAHRLGFEVGATLPVVEEGWLDPDYDLGMSGRVCAPEVYVALGISGAAEHLLGVRDARTIVAVNRDPDAPIWQAADVGVVGDWREVVPWLLPAVAQAVE